MSAIALHLEKGQLLAFLLFANDEALSYPPGTSDCVITGVPATSELFSHALGEFTQRWKNQEFQCASAAIDEGVSLSVAIDGETMIKLSLDSSGEGSWDAHQSVLVGRGYCESTKPIA